MRQIRHIGQLFIGRIGHIRPMSRILHPILHLLRRNRKKALAVSATLLILLSSLAAYLTFFAAKRASAGWFDDAWGYRKQITFGNTGSADSNKKVLFQLDTATAITAGKMQSSCQDVRFTDANGALLRYYINVSGGAGVGCNDASSDFYVLMPTIVAGNNLLFFYYGSPAAPAGTDSANFSQATFSPTSGPTASSEEKGVSPQMYLKFDEGTDNTCSAGVNDACDQTSNGNSGAISGGAAWKTEDLCLSGKCLFFDGSDDEVSVANASSIDLNDQLAGAFTLQAWVRVNSDGEGTVGRIFEKGSSTFMRVDSAGADGLADLEVSVDLQTTDATLNIADAITLNKWHHVAITYTDDGDDDATVYIDGNNRGTAAGSGATQAESASLIIAGDSGTTANFHGFIDEFKIYKSERTAAQIKTDFIKGTSSLHGAQAALGIRDYSFLSEGLVGYWKMDEASWGSPNCATDVVFDSSGNGKNGDACPSSTGPTGGNAGKFGNGITLDGSDDYINVADDPLYDLTDMTVSAWIKVTNLPAAGQSDGVVAKGTSGETSADNHTFFLFVENGQFGSGNAVNFMFEDSAGTNYAARYDTTLTTGIWYHLIGVYDTKNQRVLLYVNGVEVASQTDVTATPNTNAHPVTLGYNGWDRYLDGTIDDVRIYNRGLSPSEVSALYNWAPGPVGYWPLNENTGTTTVNDVSGNGNTGTMSGFSSSSWVQGKLGSALDFDGTDDYVNVGNSNTLDLTKQFTISGWFYRNSDSGGFERLIAKTNKDNAGNNDWSWMMQIDNTDKLEVGCVNTGDSASQLDSASTIPAGSWHHLVGIKNATEYEIYIDGVKNASGITSGIFGDCKDNNMEAYIGRLGDAGTWYYGFNGKIDDIRIYNYIRTPSQIVEDMNAGHPAPGSPIGSSTIYWKFDEQGTTANNSGTDESLDGTHSGPVFRLENSTSGGCKLNGCENFDTTTDDTLISDPAFFDSLTGMSASFWLNPQTLATTRSIVSKSNTSQETFLIQTDATNSDELRVYIADTVTDTANYYTTNNADFTAGATFANWQHIAVVYNAGAAATDRVKVYKNGRQLGGSVTGTIPSDGLTASTANFQVGESHKGTSALITYIDEVKIYNFALTQSQVYADATAGSAAAMGGVLGTHDNEGFGGNPPIGRWNFDENTGITANDSSVGFNLGSLTNGPFWVPVVGAPKYANGLAGSTLDFNGSTQYVTWGDVLNLSGQQSFTLSAWIYFDSDPLTKAEFIIEKGSNYWLWWNGDNSFSLGDNTVVFGYSRSGGDRQIANAWTPTQGRWYHIAGVHDSTGDTLKIYIDGLQLGATGTGATESLTTSTTALQVARRTIDGTRFFDGKIDDPRIYDYALSQTQIAYAFNRGGAVGYWKFDECQGTVANDSGTGLNNGTITIGGGGGNSSAGTCGGSAGQAWFDGATGKRNASIDFDGNDDYVDMGDQSEFDWERTQAMTLEAWIKTSTNTGMSIVAKQDESLSGRGYELQFGSGGLFYMQIINTYGTNGIEVRSTNDLNYDDGAWHHVVGTYDGSESATGINLYFDGKAVAMTTSFSNINATILNSVGLRIASRSDPTPQRYTGQIDEAKIYNYVLTADQVKRAYNTGSVYFGPSQGSP